MEMKVLAFEDSVDIEALLLSRGVNLDNFLIKQYWDSHDYLNRIENYDPDVLLLDHYMPPTKGLISVSYTHLTLPTNREV